MGLATNSVTDLEAIVDSIFDDAPIGIAIADESGLFVRANHEARRLMGFAASLTRTGAFDIPVQTIFHADGSELAEADLPWVRVRRERTRVAGEEVGLLQPDGNLIWVSVSAMATPSGGVVVFYQDITARRRHDDIQRARGRLVELASRSGTHDLLQATLDEAEALTGSLVGFYHFLDDDQTTLSLQAWSSRTTREFCKAEGQGRHYDLSLAGVWADCVRERRAVIHNDYASLPNKKGLPEGHAPVLRLLSIPVIRGGKIKALLGVGNKPHPYGPWDVDKVQYLADLAWDIADRRRAEETLDLKEAALESSLNALALADAGGRIRYVNDAFLKMWGYADKKSLLGRLASELSVDPAAATVLTRAVAKGEIPCGEMLALRPDGSTFTAEFTATPVNDRLGRPLGLLGTFIDVSDRRRVEVALLKSEERFALAFDIMPDAVYIFARATGHLLEVNKGFERMSGYTREEAIGKSLIDLNMFVHKEDRDRYRSILAEKGRVRRFLCEIRHSSGTIYWAESSSDPILVAGEPCVLSTTRDVTDHILAEKALRESEARFRSMFDHHDAVMLLIDPREGRILQANRAAEAYYGYPPGVLARMALVDLNEMDPAALERSIDKALEGREKFFHRRHRLASGELRHVEVHVSPVDFGGRQILFSIVHDITDRRRLEEQVRQAQKMESLGSLAGGVAHDMNNILGAILGITSLLRGDDIEDQHATDYETIIQACLRGRTMVRGLLDFTRQELVDLQPLDLNSLVEEQARLARSNLPAAMRLDLDLTPDLGCVRGDSNTLGRAIMNLVMNAIDALVDKGRIVIRTRGTSNGSIELIVDDDGPGMAKEVLEKAQDPFFTTKPVGKGTGLGLAIVYGTMKAHRGQLEITSQPGQGVRALLRFPPCDDEKVTVPVVGTPTLAKHRSLDVLLVDDDPLIQSAVSGMLRRLGHRVTAALTGAEALHVLESGASCSLVILDLNMPVLDGASTLPRLRSLRPELPVIIATGRADALAHELARTYAAVRILPKPFTYEELRQHLDAMAP
jgi:two-component system, cell cycle sensor histidine kinase and response regulator CckA